MTKLIIVFIVGLIGGVIISNTFDIRISPKSITTPTPTLAITSAPPESKDQAKIEMKENGNVFARLGYPAGGIPPLKVCIYTIPEKEGSYGSPTKCVTTDTNQTEITIMDVPTDDYHIFAWPISDEFSLSGSFTPAVSCGLKVECSDHSPLSFSVKNGESSQVDVKDWYGDGKGYPKKP